MNTTDDTARIISANIFVSDDWLCFTRCLLAWAPDFDVIYFFEKPWKWLPEFATWKLHGKPDPDDLIKFAALCEVWDASA